MFKTATINGKHIAYSEHNRFEVQWGRNSKASYETVAAFQGNLPAACIHFQGLNIRPGQKKRLICRDFNKKVILRVIG